jgi:hypothetical protein
MAGQIVPKSDSLVKQWFDQDDAPELQTLSFNGRVGERKCRNYSF